VNLEKVANLIYFFQAPIDRNMNEDKQILIVEDDLSLGYLLMESLQTEGYKVQLSRNGKTGWDHYQNGNYDLCILDVMMPEMDGFNLAKKINTQKIKTPFLFLTAKDSKEDKLEGFRLGADDYITKPFDEEEFLCRINVVLRRNEKEDYLLFSYLLFFYIIEPQNPNPIVNQIPAMIIKVFPRLGCFFNWTIPTISITIGINHSIAIRKTRTSNPCPLNSSSII